MTCLAAVTENSFTPIDQSDLRIQQQRNQTHTASSCYIKRAELTASWEIHCLQAFVHEIQKWIHSSDYNNKQ